MSFAKPSEASAASRRIVFATKGVRSFGDGMMSVGLAQYFAALDFSGFQAGLVASAALAGTSISTLLVGQYVERLGRKRLLVWGAWLMLLTGLAYALSSHLPLLVLVAFVGTVNPTSGDVSAFLPVEQAILAQQTDRESLVGTFARFNVVGALCMATGALFSGTTRLFELAPGIGDIGAIRILFGVYSLLGLAGLLLTRQLTAGVELAAGAPRGGLGKSRRRVLGLSGLFALDSFGGALVVQSLIALFLLRKFELDPAVTGAAFFGVGILAAVSYLVSAWLAGRIGLVNTMVFTHLPSNALLALIAFAPNATVAVTLLLLRGLLSQMDVPARQTLVVSIVEPDERAAAAAVTGLSRSVASSGGPWLGGAMLGGGASGLPFVVAGGLKSVYDLLLLAAYGRTERRERR